MFKCVFRTDLRNQMVGEPFACVDAEELLYSPAAHTTEECIQMLLTAEEICLGATNKREIMRGARVVGYIRIVDLRKRAASHRDVAEDAK